MRFGRLHATCAVANLAWAHPSRGTPVLAYYAANLGLGRLPLARLFSFQAKLAECRGLMPADSGLGFRQ